MSERQPMLIDIASIVGELYPDGKKLGVKPDEFEVVERHDCENA